ncbi:MAG: adenylate kinase [Anaerolineales bacterium]|nr:adenylate kinase [Anaerolineales bacterium]
MPVFIVMLGAPGAGKGTQAKLLAEKSGLTHISSGDLFRDNIKNETELGKLAKSYIDKGELVPDDLTIQMVKERLSRPDCAKGAILDGFPRTTAQAEALDATLSQMGHKIDLVPLIGVPESVLMARLSGRWTCKQCGAIYHTLFSPPKQAGICDLDGSELYQRPDDTPETVSNRIKVYSEQTAPLIEYYTQRGVLAEINGNQEIEQVTQELIDKLPEVN